jgi:hypothetical protein
MKCSGHGCGRGSKGSGYCKAPDTAQAAEMETKMKELLAARSSLDQKLATAFAAHAIYPVDPKPPSPRVVTGPGSSSTTMTSAQGNRSGAAS